MTYVELHQLEEVQDHWQKHVLTALAILLAAFVGVVAILASGERRGGDANDVPLPSMWPGEGW